MSKDLSFLKNLKLDKPPTLSQGQWLFHFGDECTINISCPWRIITNAHVALGSIDHNQLFGLDKPLNASEEAFRLLNGKMIVGSRLESVSADLQIDFENSLRLETFVHSTGYENYEIHCSDGATIIVAGGGEVNEYRQK